MVTCYEQMMMQTKFFLPTTPCPDGLKLRKNPEIPNHDKVYSTDNNSSTEDSLSFSSSEDNNNEHDALSNDDESDSKHGSYM